jgi:cell division topological specificity factor
MGLLNLFRGSRKNSASIARERLQIIVAHQRSKLQVDNQAPVYLARLQEEIVNVIKKYVDIDPNQIKVDLSHSNHGSVLELNVSLPDEK